MSPKRSAEELITSMIDAARDFYRFGWMHAASGNLSARKNKSSILITASRVHKRDLTPEDFVTIDLKGSSSAKWSKSAPPMPSTAAASYAMSTAMATTSPTTSRSSKLSPSSASS